jgi:hypothetical protein
MGSVRNFPGAWLVGQVLSPLVELREALDGLRRNQIFSSTWPALHPNNVDFRVGQPPPLCRLPYHRLLVRYVGKGWNLDPIQYFLQLQSALHGGDIAQHRRNAGKIEIAKNLWRLVEPCQLLPPFLGSEVEPVGLRVVFHRILQAAVNVVEGRDKALQSGARA